MDFIKDLQESRLTRNSLNQKNLTYNDVLEKTFLLLLILQVMRYYKGYNSKASAYARKTIQYTNYNLFRVSATDLHNLIWFAVGSEEAINKLKNPGAAKTVAGRTSIPQMAINRHLRNIAGQASAGKADVEFFTKIEQALLINDNDYKTLRRYVTNYARLGIDDRKRAVTRLLFAARAKLSDSDLISDFTDLANRNNLEDMRLTDPEAADSQTDYVDLDLKNYRLIVSPSKLPLISRFLDAANSGKTAMGAAVSAYFPLIKMVDDIIKAGPAYVEQLKVLHQRAQKQRK
jgi:hypothetical protein